MYLVQAQNCKLLLQTVYIFNKFKIIPVKKNSQIQITFLLPLDISLQVFDQFNKYFKHVKNF